MEYAYSEKCSLLVSSSDNYETTWYPFFELLKQFWKHHPHKIFLNTETISYQDETLDLINILGGKEATWSERLYRCLEQIETEYVIFTLEDFFLLDEVNDEAIEQCLRWMEENDNIAQCRLKASHCPELEENEHYAPFRLAGDEVPFRLDTQVALWRRTALMEFIDLQENPWQFEQRGTERIKGIDKIFLWYYSEQEEDRANMIFPYHVNPRYGYGVAWGRWLWNNKAWFEANGIRGVRYHKLGTLSQWAVKLRFRFLYRIGRGEPKGLEKLIWIAYRGIDRIEKGLALCRVRGIKQGLAEINKRV